MSKNPVGWFEIYVQDMKRAKTFYEAVLQVKLEKLDMPEVELWAFPMVQDGKGSAGTLAKMKGVSSGGNSVLVYFMCDDCAAATARVVSAGGRVHKEKMPIGEHGFIALAFDTEGNMIGLHSMS